MTKKRIEIRRRIGSRAVKKKDTDENEKKGRSEIN
jgi:hypothetical protein